MNTTVAGITPKEVLIARCNRAFFQAAMVAELQSVAFEDAAFLGQHRPRTYDFMHAGYAGRMTVDATDLHGEESFLQDFSKAVEHVAEHIPAAVAGDRNERAMVDHGQYRFRFRVTRYWAGRSPDDGMVEDPMQLPMGENLGREVELKIMFAV